MRIALDRSDPKPLHRQIAIRLSDAIAQGAIGIGARLPSIRDLSAQLGVSRITVESAYAALEASGEIAIIPGSGAYARARRNAAATRASALPLPEWQAALLRREADYRSGAPHALGAGAIDFASGGGDPRLFPLRGFQLAARRALAEDGVDTMGYGDPLGYGPLRRSISLVLGSQGLYVGEESILLTSGTQEAISIAARCLAAPGDSVLVESPSYPVALDLFRALGLRAIGAPCDAEGLMVEGLEALIEACRPAFLYLMPNFQNPTGACLKAARRRTLLEIAARRGIPIFEDDFVGELRYEGRAQASLKALDPGGMVIYSSGFSKMLMPGLRTGFLAMDGPALGAMARYKRVNDLSGSGYVQRALARFLDAGLYRKHIRACVRLYRERRDAMAEALHAALPGASFALPEGGLFLWLKLPEGIDSAAFALEAAARGVGIAAGRPFFAQGEEGSCCARLCFAAHDPFAIREGIARLGNTAAGRR